MMSCHGFVCASGDLWRSRLGFPWDLVSQWEGDRGSAKVKFMAVPAPLVRALVEAHARLEEPMTGAIWIRTGEPQAWLVEVLPDLGDDDQAAQPTFFNPGETFRFPLALIAANRSSLERAIRADRDLAREIAQGQVLHAGSDADELVELARAVLHSAA